MYTEKIEGGYLIRTYESGAVIKTAYYEKIEEEIVIEKATLEDKVNFLYYKSMGVI
jgi:hypothetical protein